MVMICDVTKIAGFAFSQFAVSRVSDYQIHVHFQQYPATWVMLGSHVRPSIYGRHYVLHPSCSEDTSQPVLGLDAVCSNML